MSTNVEMSHVDPFARLPGQASDAQAQAPQFTFPMPSSAASLSVGATRAVERTDAAPATYEPNDDVAIKKCAMSHFLKANAYCPPLNEVEPANTTEAALLKLVDASLCISSVAKIAPLLDLLARAATEPERASVLVVLRNTATSPNVRLAKACVAAFEKRGGLKLAKRWLEEAVALEHSGLPVLLLEVLKVLPLQLASITAARINEPIVNLRKSAREDRVKRSAQELLKLWRNKFTEKAKAQAPAAPTVASEPTGKSSSVATSVTAAAATAAVAPTATAGAGVSSSSSSTSDKVVATAASTTTTSTSSATSKAADGPSPTKSKPPKRTIKRLERLPYGGGTAVSKSSSSSDLIGNLMQRKSAKDAAAAAKPKNDSLMQKLSAKETAASASSSESGSAAESKSPPPLVAESKDEPILMALPTIQSFNAASVASSSKSSKKIRWADEEGKDLVKVKLIESWRDLILHDPSRDEESFRDAKLREHADERHALKSHKDAEKITIAVAHDWSTPALLRLPEALEKRRHAVVTDEIAIQSARTRREMEYLVLDGEIPPVSPKEWERSANDLHRGAPIAIPLSDVGAPSTDALPSVAPVFANEPQMLYEHESEDDRALREALGPLKKSTVALLLENEDILPQVYDEAQRNGNRIPDGRVIEILEQRRHQQQQQRYSAPPSAASSAYNNNSSSYGGGGGAPNYPPPSQQQAPFNDYGRQAPPHNAPGLPRAFHKQQQQVPPHHHMAAMKRKAPGGVLSDGPPPKRMMNRGSLPCIYFLQPSGCKHGNACHYLHDFNALPGGAAAPGGNSEYTYHGHHAGGGGRFGHHAGGMRSGNGGGVMRHMRGGR